MADVVALKGMRFFTRVGVLPHEAEIAQPVEVDLSVTVAPEIRPPNVVDYVALYAAVGEVMGAAHIPFLEEAAERIAAAVLGTPGVASASVTVRKPHVALGGPVEFAEVAIFRQNDG